MKSTVMKKSFLLIAVIIAALSVKSQGTLEFNQVRLITTEDAVPENKVWKIVSVMSSSQLHSTGSNTSIANSITVNSTQIFISGRSYTEQSADGNQSFGIYTQLPIWLPANTTLAASTNTGSVSVIEFNVIP